MGAPRDGYVAVPGAQLYVRDVGEGSTIVVLHGGPDFDHGYLLPDLDRLAESFRLVYYDGRGRGRSARGVEPEHVTIGSEVDDLERVREHLGLEAVAVLGHSWGGVLALEHATRHPERVSHLILLNTAPASHDDYLLLREELPKARAPGEVEQMRAIAAGAGYAAGDPDTMAAYYRLHYRPTVRPDLLDGLIATMRAGFTRTGVLRGRAIENRLREQTWLSPGYDLLPGLARLGAPTLVLHGEHDFVPLACAAHVAEAIPGARLVVLPGAGHFSYLERPDEVRRELEALFVS